VKRLSAFLVSTRAWLLVALLATLLPAALVLPGLTSHNSIYTYLAEGDPSLAFHERTAERFGGDSLAFISAEARAGETIFNAPDLARIRVLTGEIAGIGGVSRVVSLSNADAITGVDGGVKIAPLLADEIPTGEQRLRHLRRTVLASPLLNELLSSDLSASVITVHLDRRRLRDPTFQKQVVADLRALLARHGGAASGLRLTGDAVLAEAVDQYSQRDQQIFGAVMMALLALSSLIMFRRAAAVMLPVTVVLLSVAWTMGLFVLLGFSTNAVTAIIPSVLCLVSMSSATHFHFRFLALSDGPRPPREAMIETLRSVTVPCFFTALTTAIGLGSLAVSQVMPIRIFGLFAGLGVLLSLVATVALAPSLLPRTGRRPPAGAASTIRLILGHTYELGRRRNTVLLVAALLGALGLAGIFRIRLETDVLAYFKRDAPVVQDVLRMERLFGGTSALDVIIDTGRDGGAMDPRVLNAVATLQGRYEQMPRVMRGVSLADVTGELNRALEGDDALRVPTTAAAVNQLLLVLTEPELIEPMVDFQRRTLRLATRFTGATLGVAPSRRLVEQVQAAARGLFPAGVKVRYTGFPLLYINMDRYLVRSQIQSFGLVLGVLLLLLTIMFGSLRMGLLAMIPNALPILLVLGLMGWAGIALEGSTIMIASIAIGIGVDDTIHFLYRLRRELANGADLEGAIARTLDGVGRPLLFTSLVLTLGFCVFCFSDFVGTRNFGGLTALAITGALLSDLFVLPAVLRLTGVPAGWGK